MFTKRSEATRNWTTQSAALAALIGAAAILSFPAAGAQAKVKFYYKFTAENGQTYPGGLLVQGENGDLYGELNPNYSQIYESSGSHTVWNSGEDSGDVCYTGMTLGTDGMLYGTCSEWGYNENASGVIFQLNPNKKKNNFNILYTYPAYGDGGYEWPSALTLGADGNFYGTTHSDLTNPDGTVFMITPQGVYTTIHVFQGGANDGALPSMVSTGEYFQPVPLTLGSDGNFYGTTDEGGANGAGTVFQITPAGAVTVLYSFPEGSCTCVGVTELNGNFYGQTQRGGANDEGEIYELTLGGAFTVLHSFDAASDNAEFPDFLLTLGSDGNFYDVTSSYQSGGFGPESLYEITPSGTYSDLYHGFGPGSCGEVKYGCLVNSPLLLNTNGEFYGATAQGGAATAGTLYRAQVNQSPFARLQLPTQKTGRWMGILGQGFAKATGVSFNGKPAEFKVVSDSFLRARVPSGAGKGRVTVTMPEGELRSNMDFTPLH